MIASPLDDTVRRASGLEVGGWPLVIERRDTRGDGFERADALHRPGPLLEHRIAASAALGDTEHRHVGAQWWFERCAFLAATIAFACALTSRRLPSLDPADVFIAGADGLAAGLGLRDVPLACDGADRLAAVARTEIEGHLEPLADAIGALRLRPAKALWRSAGDRAVQAALWIGTATGAHDHALAFVEAVLIPGSRLHVPIRLTAPAADPACVHQRSSCCLAHRTPANLICDGCPRAHGLDRALVSLPPGGA